MERIHPRGLSVSIYLWAHEKSNIVYLTQKQGFSGSEQMLRAGVQRVCVSLHVLLCRSAHVYQFDEKLSEIIS